MTDEGETTKGSKKTSWEPKKSVTREIRKADRTIPWEPKSTVMKTIREGYVPKKAKKTDE